MQTQEAPSRLSTGLAPRDLNREPEVNKATNALSNAINQLQEAIESLASRLSPVSRNEPQNPKPNGRSDVPAACALASSIFTKTAKIEDLANEIQKLNDRLEI